jgi:hypothetical protein
LLVATSPARVDKHALQQATEAPRHRKIHFSSVSFVMASDVRGMHEAVSVMQLPGWYGMDAVRGTALLLSAPSPSVVYVR